MRTEKPLPVCGNCGAPLEGGSGNPACPQCTAALVPDRVTPGDVAGALMTRLGPPDGAPASAAETLEGFPDQFAAGMRELEADTGEPSAERLNAGIPRGRLQYESYLRSCAQSGENNPDDFEAFRARGIESGWWAGDEADPITAEVDRMNVEDATREYAAACRSGVKSMTRDEVLAMLAVTPEMAAAWDVQEAALRSFTRSYFLLHDPQIMDGLSEDAFQSLILMHARKNGWKGKTRPHVRFHSQRNPQTGEVERGYMIRWLDDVRPVGQNPEDPYPGNDYRRAVAAAAAQEAGCVLIDQKTALAIAEILFDVQRQRFKAQPSLKGIASRDLFGLGVRDFVAALQPLFAVRDPYPGPDENQKLIGDWLLPDPQGPKTMDRWRAYQVMQGSDGRLYWRWTGGNYTNPVSAAMREKLLTKGVRLMPLT